MKKILIFLILTIIINRVYSQSGEYTYFVLKVGMSHHAFSAQPSGEFAQIYAQTPDGQMKLQPSSQFFDYVPGFHAGLDFHYDFDNNKIGVIAGAHYSTFGFSSKWQTYNEFETVVKNNYSLVQTFKMSTISIPLLIKFGPEIFEDQNYIYAGLQYNYNLGMSESLKLDWSTKGSGRKCETDEFASSNIGIVIGYNYQIFNIELNYYPKNIVNNEYINYYDINNTPLKQDDDIKYKPYSGMPKSLIVVKTSITLPLSDWSTKHNYWLSKLFRKLKFW